MLMAHLAVFDVAVGCSRVRYGSYGGVKLSRVASSSATERIGRN